MNNDPFICSTQDAGLGNRLKSFWSACRIDPDARLRWRRDRISGLIPEYRDQVSIEPFEDLFVETFRVSEWEATMAAWMTWKLIPFPEDGLSYIDFMYQKTPPTAIKAYREISKLLTPVPGILDEAEKFAEQFPKETTAIHARTKFDYHRQRRHYEVFVQRILDNRPCFLATDSVELREAMQKENGVFLYSADSERLVVSDWRSALIEMLLLGKCSKMLATKHSTFCEAAWWLAGATQEVEII